MVVYRKENFVQGAIYSKCMLGLRFTSNSTTVYASLSPSLYLNVRDVYFNTMKDQMYIVENTLNQEYYNVK